jgi:recombinational DNA repair protein (RecF pathway)
LSYREVGGVTYHDEGVVLTTAKLGEADRIITMLTKEHGKIRAVARVSDAANRASERGWNLLCEAMY